MHKAIAGSIFFASIFAANAAYFAHFYIKHKAHTLRQWPERDIPASVQASLGFALIFGILAAAFLVIAWGEVT